MIDLSKLNLPKQEPNNQKINRFWIHALIAIYPNGEMKFEKQWMQAEAGMAKKKEPKKKVMENFSKKNNEVEDL